MRGTRPLWGMLTGLVCLTVSGAAFAQTEAYQVYSNPDGYQVEIPSTWQQSTLPGPPDGTEFDSPDGNARVILQAGALPGTPNGLDVLNGLESNLRQEQPDLATVPPTLSNVPGATISFIASGLFTLNGTYRDVYFLDAIQGSDLYTATILMTHDYAQSHFDDVEHIRSTFQLVSAMQAPPLVSPPSAAAPGGGGPPPSQATAPAPAPPASASSGAGTPGAAAAPTGGSFPAAGTPAALPPGTVFQATNQNGQTDQTFTVPNEWSLHFVYDCTGFAGVSGGTFNVSIYHADGTPSLENSPIQIAAQGGLAGDTQHYHSGGTFYLDVLSDCSWNVSVTAP